MEIGNVTDCLYIVETMVGTFAIRSRPFICRKMRIMKDLIKRLKEFFKNDAIDRNVTDFLNIVRTMVGAFAIYSSFTVDLVEFCEQDLY
jgi:hypothetical protein